MTSTTDTAHNPTWGEEDYMAAEFQKMTDKFVSQGITVVLGEFEAMNRTTQLSGANLDLHLRGGRITHKTVVGLCQQPWIEAHLLGHRGGDLRLDHGCKKLTRIT